MLITHFLEQILLLNDKWLCVYVDPGNQEKKKSIYEEDEHMMFKLWDKYSLAECWTLLTLIAISSLRFDLKEVLYVGSLWVGAVSSLSPRHSLECKCHLAPGAGMLTLCKHREYYRIILDFTRYRHRKPRWLIGLVLVTRKRADSIIAVWSSGLFFEGCDQAVEEL